MVPPASNPIRKWPAASSACIAGGWLAKGLTVFHLNFRFAEMFIYNHLNLGLVLGLPKMA